MFVRADISDEADAASLATAAEEHFGRLDILVNNAAAFVLKGLDATREDWQRSPGRQRDRHVDGHAGGCRGDAHGATAARS